MRLLPFISLAILLSGCASTDLGHHANPMFCNEKAREVLQDHFNHDLFSVSCTAVDCYYMDKGAGEYLCKKLCITEAGLARISYVVWDINGEKGCE